MHSNSESSDLLVFSHLRWDFVFQRPQHILSRHAKNRRVFYFEEPVFGMTDAPRLHIKESDENVQVVVPYLPAGIEAQASEAALRELVDELVSEEELRDMTIWYYSPMAFSFSKHLNADVVIFDCMDEHSLVAGAPQTLIDCEAELMRKAHVVFTAGQSLYQAKKNKHHNIYAIPSSIDYGHFSKGRAAMIEADDQVSIPQPRIGFYGVIDERFDTKLLQEMADLRQDYHFVIIGPVARIDQSTLPQRENIHYLGKKEYTDLPLYLAGWDCAMIPFVLNDSTRFISPMKTPEYLAAGIPVVSTSIQDVVHPYAIAELVYIADDPKKFLECIDRAMAEKEDGPRWLTKVDRFLEGSTWDTSFEKMLSHEQKIRELNKLPKKDYKLPSYMDPALSAIGIV